MKQYKIPVEYTIIADSAEEALDTARRDIREIPKPDVSDHFEGRFKLGIDKSTEEEIIETIESLNK